MYDFILQLALISSLSLIVYLLARALPRVKTDEHQLSVYDYIEDFLGRLPLHHIDQSLSLQTEKFLRKTRVIVMKVDNLINGYLNNKKTKGNNGNGSSKELVDYLKKDNREV